MEALDTNKPARQEDISDSKRKPVTTLETVESFGEKDDPAQNDPGEAPTTPITTPPTGGAFKHFLRGSFSFVAYWWRGVIACVVMLCSLMAIILILALHQNRPLPNWPFTITLNSLVSIMVVILKSSMLAVLASGLSQTKWRWFEKPRLISHYAIYDKATQGLTDTLTLLWTLRGKQIVGCIGLSAIIIAVAIDPFTQQVIQYYESTALSDVGGNATLPRTTVYDLYRPHVGAGINAIDIPMLGAIQAGFWTPSTDSYAVSVSNCITGNCTFTEPYQSIGIGSACSDLTNKVSGFCNYYYNGSRGLCNYTLPTGTTLSVDGSITEQWTVGNNTWGTVSGTPDDLAGREFIWSNNFNATPTCYLKSCTTNTTCQGTACLVSAAGCYLYPCLETYTANVSNGILKENVVSSIPLPSDGYATCWTSLRKDCLTPTDWTTLSSQGIHPSDYNSSDYILYCNSTDNLADITNACVFSLAFEAYNAFQYFFTFTASFNEGQFLAGNFVGDSQSTVVGPTDLYYLYDAGLMTFANATAAYAGIANAMTARIRIGTVGSNYSAPAQGAIYYTQTLIRVEWKWLALPLLLVALTLLFVVAVMVQTSINGREPLGEEFVLRLLFAGVAGEAGERPLDMGNGKSFWQSLMGFRGWKGRREQRAGAQEVEEVQIQMKTNEDGRWRLLKL